MKMLSCWLSALWSPVTSTWPSPGSTDFQPVPQTPLSPRSALIHVCIGSFVHSFFAGRRNYLWGGEGGGCQSLRTQRQVHLYLGPNQNSSLTTVAAINKNKAPTKCQWLSKSAFPSFLSQCTKGHVGGGGLGSQTWGGEQHAGLQGLPWGGTSWPSAQLDGTGWPPSGERGDVQKKIGQRPPQPSSPPCSVTRQNAPASISGKGHLHALHSHAPADRRHVDARRNHFRAIGQARPVLGPEAPDVRVAVAPVLATLFQDDGFGGGVQAHVHGKLCPHVTAERWGTLRPALSPDRATQRERATAKHLTPQLRLPAARPPPASS